MLDHVFVLIAHAGRRSGRRRETVAMAAAYDPETLEVVVCSAWGNSGWIRNLRAHPALEIQIGHHAYVPEHRFLSADEAVAVVTAFRARHPHRLRLIAAILGWGDLTTEEAVREFVHDRPFVSFRPARSPESEVR
jgi:deazaflavin-dependent oxidoreductase (nitroreductase family)